jgi:hypothetical protein
MGVASRRLPLVAVLALLAAALLAPPALARRPRRHSLLRSRELWATIDVCSPHDQPHTIGIRGSMPGDGHPKDRMFMLFRLQYMDTTAKRWVDLPGDTRSRLVSLGRAKAARQTGWSFKLVPGATTAALRGVVTFQWRRRKTLVLSVSRPTTAGHHSLAGADPRSFSAATCSIG